MILRQARLRPAEVGQRLPDGHRLRQLTHSSGGTANNNPHSWSPDGKKIVFARKRDDLSDLFVMNAAGSRARQLTHVGDAHFASWGTHP